MKVKDLIEKLKEYPEDMSVYCQEEGYFLYPLEDEENKVFSVLDIPLESPDEHYHNGSMFLILNRVDDRDFGKKILLINNYLFS